jgi:O-antigen/teichoic acid export membrane protein
MAAMVAKEQPPSRANGEDAAPASTGAASTSDAEHARREGALAFRNAIKLAASLVLTWGVALIVTFKLPKYLGPTLFGHYKFGDQFAMSLAVFLSLGFDTYISREVAVRPKHASDFFGGLLVARALVIVPLVGFAMVFLRDAVPDRRVAALLFGFAYLFTGLNQTFQQTLQAASNVGRLAVANVVAKVLWGGGTLAALLLGAPLWVLPLPLVASEALKASFLYLATKDAIDLEIRFDFAATKKVLVVAFPFFVANVAVNLGSSIDVVMLGKLMDETSPEVGWYGSARQIAQLSALLSPILSGVLIPMMSRAKARSEEEFFRILRRGIEGVMVLSIPMTLILALGADLWIRIALKAEFAPAAASLRWLAPTFVLAYGNVLLWLSLMILDRSWTITLVSILGMVILPIFILVLVPITGPTGVGGAGMGVAMALSARELVTVVIFLFFLGRRALDRRNVGATTKSFAIAGVVVLADHFLGMLSPALRIAADAGLYGVLAVALGVLRPADAKTVLKLVKDRKKAAAA